MGSGVYDSDTLVLATDQAMGADFTTPWHETKYHDMGAMQLWWSGADATNGKFIVQFSLDMVHWTDSIDEADAASVCSASSGDFRYAYLKKNVFTKILLNWITERATILEQCFS